MARVKQQELTLEEKLEQALVPEDEWPYEVPGNWVWVRLGSVVNIKRGASPRPIKSFITEDGNGINWIKIGDTGEGKYVFSVKEKITIEGAKKSVFVEQGTLLLSNSMSFGRPYILNIDGCIHDGWLAITVSDCFDKEYMYYALLSSNWYFEQVAVGTAVRNLNSERVAGLPVILPPFAEQRRIVDQIESLFAKLDQARELAQNALDTFETRKAAVLHKAFTGELTAKWREKNGVGMESWEEKTLNEICKISSGGTPSRDNSEFYNGNIPWVKTGEITWNYIYDTEEKITEEAIANSSAKLFPVGTVLVAMYGQGLTRGRAAILGITAATNQAVCALMPFENISNKFLFYYFMKNYWDFREKAVGGNQPNYSGTMIGRFSIVLPSLPEQQEIVRILDRLFEKEQKAKELCDVIDKIDLMKKAILAKAFRGELGTNDPSEESAVELLKECLGQPSI
jgi:type I restriction enzyme S subunit